MRSETKTRFMYIRDEKRNPVGCIAFIIGATSAQFGVSIRSPNEKIADPKRGREIAEARLQTARRLNNTVSYNADSSLFDITNAILAAVSDSVVEAKVDNGIQVIAAKPLCTPRIRKNIEAMIARNKVQSLLRNKDAANAAKG